MNDKNATGLRWFVWEWKSLWEPMIESTLITFEARQHQIRIYSDVLGHRAWLQHFILSPDAYAFQICHGGNIISYLITEKGFLWKGNRDFNFFNPIRTQVVAKDYSRVFMYEAILRWQSLNSFESLKAWSISKFARLKGCSFQGEEKKYIGTRRAWQDQIRFWCSSIWSLKL